MYAEPPGFDREQLKRVLQEQWGITTVRMSYEPVGFGTHHYRVAATDGSEWFANIDEPAVPATLEAAFRTALALRTAGLEFVHAPTPCADGRCVVPMGRYAVSVVAFIEGTSHPYGEYPSEELRRLVLQALGRMHSVKPPDFTRRDTLAVPQRDGLLETLEHLSQTWTGGPYAEDARLLVRQRTGRIREWFARYDELVPVVRAGAHSWVVTHREPHAANVMSTPDGSIKLIDWDTVAVGPRERDLWMIEPRTDEDWAAYAGTSGVWETDPAAMELYRLWWTLAEVCDFVMLFRQTHIDDGNTRVAWRELRSYLDPPSP